MASRRGAKENCGAVEEHRGIAKCNDARPLLAEVYDWFPEGFDTADFQEARALLEELT